VIVSKREKYIAFGTGGAILLLMLNSLVWEPYWQSVSDVDNSIAAAKAQLASNTTTEKLKTMATPRWNSLMREGLTSNQSQTESNLEHALLTWGVSAGVDTQDLHGDPAKKEGDFFEVGYRVTVFGSTSQLAKLLRLIETTTTIPVRISDLQINPQPEGSDHLQAHLEVTTLCLPETASTAEPAANPFDLEGAFQ
jgi:hypothetical protein